MIYLGIDYGEKRIGLAKGDSLLKIATPLKTILNSEGVLNELADIVNTEAVEKIIVGIPVSFNGETNEFAEKIIEFSEDLEARTDVSVETINEIFSLLSRTHFHCSWDVNSLNSVFVMLLFSLILPHSSLICFKIFVSFNHF